MRVIQTLFLTALLSAIALASNPAHTAKYAASQLSALTSALPKTKHSLHHPRHVKHVKHLFGAKQAAGTCDAAGFAEATSRVVQACPSLSGLVSGTTAPEEFLPTFCASECFTVLLEEFKKHRGCVDEQTIFLVGMVAMCETRPHCYSKPVVTEQVTFEKECAAGMQAIGNVSDLSTLDLAKTTCDGNCRTRGAELYDQYPECMVNPEGIPQSFGPIKGMLDFMCNDVGGEKCTVSLRGLARLDCTAATCSNKAYWCAASGSDCNVAPTADNLKSLCTSCLDGLVAIADAPGGDANGAIQVVASRELICGRVNPGDETSNLCYLPTATAFGTGMALMKAGTFSGASNEAMCSGDLFKCMPRFMGLSAVLNDGQSRKTFSKCVGTAGKTVASCQPALETSLAESETLRTMSLGVCEVNGQSGAGAARCLTVGLAVAGWASTACLATCTAGADATCASMTTPIPGANAITGLMGCCGPFVNAYVASVVPSVFGGNWLPAGAQTVGGKAVTFTAANAVTGDVEKAKRPLASVAKCATVATETAAWTMFEAKCSAVSTVKELSLPLYVSFERANAKAGLLRRLSDALRTDMSANLGVPTHYIRSSVVAEDKAVMVNLRAGGKRRQAAAGQGAGMKLTFTVDGMAAADVTLAAGIFDARLAKGAIYAPAAATVLVNECPECSDAYSSSAVRPAVQQTTAAPGTFQTTEAATSAPLSVFLAAAAGLALSLVA